MLVSFTLENCASFQQAATLNMEASAIKMHALSLIKEGDETLLPVAAIYGPNASGKSSLLNALVQLMKKIAGIEKVYVLPFLLDKENGPTPYRLEAVFLLCGKRYRLELKCLLDTNLSEALYLVSGQKEKLLYRRRRMKGRFDIALGEGLNAAEQKEIGYVAEMEQEQESLLLTALGKRGKIDYCAALYRYARDAVMHREEGRLRYNNIYFEEESLVDAYLDDENRHKRYLDFVRLADPLIEKLEKEEVDKQPERKRPKYRMHLSMAGQDEDIDMTTLESDGTLMAARLFPYIDKVLREGGLLVVDELERSLHPLLMAYVVNLFTSPETNPGRGQLVFTTHNVLFMDKKYLRRDEIWFVDKDKAGRSSLYSLYDIEGVRSDRDYCKSYILGAFGAVPEQLFKGARDGQAEE